MQSVYVTNCWGNACALGMLDSRCRPKHFSVMRRMERRQAGRKVRAGLGESVTTEPDRQVHVPISLCACDPWQTGQWLQASHLLRASSDRLLEAEPSPRVEGWWEGRRQHLPLHWNRWVGVVSRSRSAMGSGLLQRAMPGSLYPAFTHSDSQRRLQSQCSGFVPSALGAEQEVRVPPPRWAPGAIPFALWESRVFGLWPDWACLA